MQAKLLAVVGALLVAAGGIGLIAAYEAQGFAAAALCWAAILGGAVMLMMGAARFMSGFMAPQQSVESAYGEAEIRLLVQCMGAVAAADGKIAGAETDTIASIHERMLGLKIPAAEVASILYEFKTDFDITAMLVADREKLSPVMRQIIVKSCYLVMMSDLDESGAETGKIKEIGRALGFTGEDVDDLIAMAGV